MCYNGPKRTRGTRMGRPRKKDSQLRAYWRESKRKAKNKAVDQTANPSLNNNVTSDANKINEER
jgi:hypothetical protein